MPDLRTLGERIESLLANFDRVLTPAQARGNAEELVSGLVHLYGTGLTRVLEAIDESGDGAAQAIFERLCDDDLVASLMVLHGLHPLGLEERIGRALDGVRPYLKSHEGSVEILRVEDGVVYLRLGGSCHGCPSSTETLRLAIRRAILEAAPEITDVLAEGAVDEEPVTTSTLRVLSDWIALDSFPELAPGAFAALEIGGAPVLLAQSHESRYAYRNQCPHCMRGLAEATLEWPILTCAGCAATFDVVKAGREIGGTAHLEPVPMVEEDGRIRLAMPALA
ncbi:MAG TPA: NifU family protein [Candidatus Baltobacteraceae bacterium]|jgi:Fe-S cluster biogenesis protein NfuA/nitrite reductase/ring-hydroxylating ferredoxin subunit